MNQPPKLAGNQVLNPNRLGYTKAGRVNTANPSRTIPDIQYIIDAVVQALRQTPLQPLPVTADISHRSFNSIPAPSENDHGSPIVWQRVKCAEKLIPFSGKEENVTKWFERIEHIARRYQFTSDILLLAAVSQLKERALNWYNRQPFESVSTWDEFQTQLK